MDFVFSKRAKMVAIILMAVGLIGSIVGSLMGGGHDHGHSHIADRVWSNLLINGFFFFGISLAGLFFLALQYAAEVAWSVMVKRVFEAVISFLPIGGAVIILVLAAGQFHMHHIYHWMDPNVYDMTSPEYDELIANKYAYLNPIFFWARTLVFIGVWYYFARWFRKKSLEQDLVGGTAIHYKSVTKAAIFLVIFGFSSSVMSWDWLMSIDTHWFSTMYGWFVFSGMWVSAMITCTLIVIYLKSKGLLQNFNQSHLHDMGKWVFAISMLWTYLWFCQFMLIWYANIPEEVTYYVERIKHYPLLFFGITFINFFFPFFILMSRDAKRNIIFLLPVSLIILVGHWLDVYLLVTPGVMHDAGAHFGLLEISMFLGFLGLFVFTVFTQLAKAPLEVKNHPFLEESVHHHI